MKATESEIAPSVAGQSLKMCFPGRKKGRQGVVSGIQGAADGGREWGNRCPHMARPSQAGVEDKHRRKKGSKR